MTQIKSVRGMRDLMPDETPLWAQLETTIRSVVGRYGFREMRIPIIEATELFSRSIGEVTDIVEKEMYTFSMHEEHTQLTLRPEATAGFVRAGIEHGLLHNQVQRIWCIGPMFRYEKPQKGRYRQFHQLDVEAFGLPGPDIDAELIVLLARLWRELGIEGLRLQINSLGSARSRQQHRERLIEYFQANHDQLDEDSQRRLLRNPLRILDSKNEAMAEMIDAAPRLVDFLEQDCERHFEQLQELLTSAGIEFEINPRLVRGLDYYNRTVFEWIADDGLGAQNTVCGGGRYDGLVAHLGGRDTPGIGFGLGLERLVLILQQLGRTAERDPHVYLIAAGDRAQRERFGIAERLRDSLPGLRVLMHCGGGGMKSQFKRADRSNARFALIIGDDELAENRPSIKDLRSVDTEQRSLAFDELSQFFGAELNLNP